MSEHGTNPAYSPNHIPARKRDLHLAISILLASYGVHGLWTDDLWVPLGLHGKDGLHLYGPAAWMMFAAILCAVLNMLPVIVDHYDTRNNETNYRRFANLTLWSGIALGIISITWGISDNETASKLRQMYSALDGAGLFRHIPARF